VVQRGALEQPRLSPRRGEDENSIRGYLGAPKRRDVAVRSITQFELNAKPVRNFFCTPLISDQVARGGNNIGLPPVGMVLANDDLQTGRSDFRGDHLSESSGGDAFLDHDEFPTKENDRE
jgi:hypothetical protein